MAEQMKAWQMTGPGPIETILKLQDVPRLVQPLKPNHVIVKVARASINPADYKVPELGIASRAMISYPKTPGMDLSGSIVAVGTEAKDIAVGDRVMGRVDPMGHHGALAEYTSVSRDSIAKLPADFDLDQAAGAPTVAITGYQSIQPYVKPGSKVFINGGSGGAGSFAIQVSKQLGCHVTVTCSTGKIDLCKSLGADEIIDYRTQDVVETLQKSGTLYDHVVDNVGHSPNNLAQTCHTFTNPDAKFIFVGGSTKAAGHIASAMMPGFLGGSKRKVVTFLAKENRADFEQLGAWLAEGKMKTIVEKTFPFGEAAEAYKALKGGSSTGKLIVSVE